MPRDSLSVSITNDLIGLIINRKLKPGDVLPSEAELARQFSVSKPTVREAIQELSIFGMIERRQGRATRVKSIDSSVLSSFFRISIGYSEHGVRNVLELRRGLEVEIAQLAARRATAEDVENIQACVLQMEASKGDIDLWLQNDLNFHLAVTNASGNEIMINMVMGLKNVIIYTMRAIGMQRDLRDAVKTLERHQRIAEAINNRDPDEAREAMQAHFSATDPILDAIRLDNRRLAQADLMKAIES